MDGQRTGMEMKRLTVRQIQSLFTQAKYFIFVTFDHLKIDLVCFDEIACCFGRDSLPETNLRPKVDAEGWMTKQYHFVMLILQAPSKDCKEKNREPLTWFIYKRARSFHSTFDVLSCVPTNLQLQSPSKEDLHDSISLYSSLSLWSSGQSFSTTTFL